MKELKMCIAVNTLKIVKSLDTGIYVATDRLTRKIRKIKGTGFKDPQSQLEKNVYQVGHTARTTLTGLGNVVIERTLGIEEGAKKYLAHRENLADICLTSWEQRTPDTWGEIYREMNSTSDEFKKRGIDVNEKL
jgi:hypothetical protein